MKKKHQLSQLFQLLSLLACAFIGLSVVTPAQAGSGTLPSLASDAQVNQLNGVNAVTNATATFASIGGNNGTQEGVVFVFQIPASILSDPTQQFSAATFTAKLGSSSASGYNVNGDLYGLGVSSSPSVLASDFYEGALDSSNTLIQDNLITPATLSYTTVSTSNTALISYLNAELATARSFGLSTAYVFFRINPDAYLYWNGYLIGMSEAQSPYPPTLSYTTASVPVWQTAPLGGGGFVTGLACNADGSAIYCRTDVGGAFRWNPAVDGNNGSWQSLTDSLVPFGTSGASSLFGVEAIATDPSNLDRIYMGAANHIYESDDEGTTWTSINPSNPITMSGNGGGKTCGERLAVDPNNPNIVWYGSINNGLYRGDKTSGSWVWIQISSTLVPAGTAGTGVSFVVCDKNGGTTVVYAGVSDPNSGGVYVGNSAGTTWTKAGVASGTPLTPRRAQVASNGNLYVTCGTNGVYRMARGGTLSQLTALPTTLVYDGTVNYSAVAVDPNDATGNTVYVAELNSAISYNSFWRTANGGTSWTSQRTIFNGVSPNGSTIFNARTEPDGTPSLTGSWFEAVAALMVNPANSSELWSTDFFGVYRTRDAQDLGNNTLPPSGPGGCYWYALQKGQEETFGLSILSPPSGAPLLTGLSDDGGCRYNDITVRPTGTGGSRFSNPSGGNTTSMDFCESNPLVMARAWVDGNRSTGACAVSSDGGSTWTEYNPGGNLWKGGGRIAVSSTNSQNMVWMPIKNPSATTYAYYSTNGGATWTVSTGGPASNTVDVYTNGSSLGCSGQNLAADRANGLFYLASFGGATHTIYKSTNGATWTVAGTVSNGGTYNMITPQIVAAPVSPTNPSGGDVWLCDDDTYNHNAGAGGLWRSTDSAGHWSKITTVGAVTAVGFGKSSTGTGYSVYIYGYVGGVLGIYRSDDYGATAAGWVKLPNPTNETISALVGDRQHYNSVFLGTLGRGVFHY